MSRRLNNTVHVFDEEKGDYVAFGPDDDVPAKLAKLIGDHAWAEDEADVDDDGVDSREPGAVPPRAGRGSGREEWLSFVRENGMDADDDEDRASLIAKAEDAGLIEPVEQ